MNTHASVMEEKIHSQSEGVTKTSGNVTAQMAPEGGEPSSSYPYPPVNSYTEWDPLEEVIVGDIEGAHVPPWHVTLIATMPEKHFPFFQELGGRPFPQELVRAAGLELDAFIRLLEREGVTVKTPTKTSYASPFSTPHWRSASGLYSAMPRDLILVVGDELIEAPTAWRSRYFEIHAFRPLLKDYFHRGARWTAAPKPELRDELFKEHSLIPRDPAYGDYVVCEFEPTFDAADFIRCGRDLFVQRSHVTNRSGIEWVRRHLSPRHRVHEVNVHDPSAMHIDATLVPLAPGKLLINPERVLEVPPLFRSWDVRAAPKPTIPDDHPLYMSSKWLSMNILMLDEKRVVVEENEEPLIRTLVDWGFEPIPCAFRHFYAFGGSFHCATLDVRRRGGLMTYF